MEPGAGHPAAADRRAVEPGAGHPAAREASRQSAPAPAEVSPAGWEARAAAAPAQLGVPRRNRRGCSRARRGSRGPAGCHCRSLRPFRLKSSVSPCEPRPALHRDKESHPTARINGKNPKSRALHRCGTTPDSHRSGLRWARFTGELGAATPASLAEDAGFEPARGLPQPAFQASAIGH